MGCRGVSIENGGCRRVAEAEGDEYKWRVAKGALSGLAHTKSDWRAGTTSELMAMQSSDAAARSPRKASDHDMGCRFEQETPTMDLHSKTGPEGLSPVVVGSSPIEVGESRPNGALIFSNDLGPGSPSAPRPKDCSQNKARSPSLLKTNLIRANDSHILSAEERYSQPKPMSSPTSFCLDRLPQLEESFGHGGTDETSQASEDVERVGSQGTALIPSAISPSSTRPLSRELVAVEERNVQQCEDGDKDVNREVQQVGDPTCVASASSGAATCSPWTAPILDGGSRATKMETPTVGYPSKAGPERLSPTKVGTRPLKGGKPKPTGFFSHGLGPSYLSSSRSKELDKARTPFFLHKDRAKDSLLSSDEERYGSLMPLYSSPASPCLDRTPHLAESFGHGSPEEIPQDCVGSQGIVLTPLAILPPSSSTRPLCRDLVAVEEREVQAVQKCEDGDKDENRGK